MSHKVLAVILARGGSKGIPKKNIYKICGHPLLSYSIEAAKNSKYINKIVVSTDDKKIAKVSKDYGAYAPFIRSKKLSGDKVPSVDALYDCVRRSEKYFKENFEYIIELPCVAPLRDSLDIDKALEILFTQKYDSVISYVNTGEKHPTRLKRIKNNIVTNFCKEYPEPDIGSRRQDFESCFIRNGAIYSMTRKCILIHKSRNGKKSFPLIMDSKKSINIDEKFDLNLAELLIENGYCNNKPKLIQKKKQEFRVGKNPNKKNILITAPVYFFKKYLSVLEKNFNCFYIEKPDEIKLIEKIKNIHGWICHPSPEYFIDRKILSNTNFLEIIATPSTGTTHIDLDYCKKRKIKVLPITVSKKFEKIKASSEFTFLLCLLGFKNLIGAINQVRAGNWRNIENKIRGNEVIGKKVGIIGFGRIGKNLFKYFSAMGAEVNYFDIKKRKPSSKIKSKNQILKTSDLIVVCISYNKKNIDFVNKDFFSKMKKNSVFVNTSRGEVVNENALIHALKTKKLKFALIDVIKNEQYLKTKKNKLIEYAKKCNNLLISPHMAGLTEESEKKAFLISVENIIKYFKK
tara:strand:+ start:224 stop:1942 length:1719 start_codon:yes stop_codon:yes gene_type:complete